MTSRHDQPAEQLAQPETERELAQPSEAQRQRLQDATPYPAWTSPLHGEL